VTERIISADSHVNIRTEDVFRHLDARYHDAYLEGQKASWRRMLRAKPQKKAQMPNMGEGAPWEAAGRPGAYDPNARLADMDQDHVDAEVLYADPTGGAQFYEMDEGHLEALRAFNSAALEFAAIDPKRLLVLYLLPLHDVDEAVREIERIAAEGARGVHLPLWPRELGLPNYWDERYDPIWAALSEIGLPVSQHVGSGQWMGEMLAEDPTPAKALYQALPPIFMSEILASWIVTGVLERFPKLRIVLVEAGLGWIPYFLERLDTMQERHRWDTYEGMIREKPSTYWYRQMAATFEEDRYGVDNRHRIGVENLMWATDYPHPDTTWPNSQQVIREHFADVPDEEMRLMVGGNAARLYGL
jgi:predicted TIM-barrel fold metal-dependent hydrolase